MTSLCYERTQMIPRSDYKRCIRKNESKNIEEKGTNQQKAITTRRRLFRNITIIHACGVHWGKIAVKSGQN